MCEGLPAPADGHVLCVRDDIVDANEQRLWMPAVSA
jgi:hypothetical protein